MSREVRVLQSWLAPRPRRQPAVYAGELAARCRRPPSARSNAHASAQGALPHAVKTSECFWTLGALLACGSSAPPEIADAAPEDGSIHITLQKMEPVRLVAAGLATQLLMRDRAPQGKTWECFLLGHAALDVLTGEADRKRILLERFQAEARRPKRKCAPRTQTTRSSLCLLADSRLRLQRCRAERRGSRRVYLHALRRMQITPTGTAHCKPAAAAAAAAAAGLARRAQRRRCDRAVMLI